MTDLEFLDAHAEHFDATGNLYLPESEGGKPGNADVYVCSPPAKNFNASGGPGAANGRGVCTPKAGIKVGSIVQFESELFLVLAIEGFKVWLSDSGDYISSQPLPWLTLTNKTALA